MKIRQNLIIAVIVSLLLLGTFGGYGLLNAKADGQESENMVAYYNFDGASLTADRSVCGNDAEIYGALSAAEGIYGNGLKFTDSRENYLSLPSRILTESGNVAQGTTSATIAFWFRFDEIKSGYTQILNFGNMNDDNRIRFLINQFGEMRLEYEVQGAGNLTELVCWGDAEWKPVADVWYHAAIVIDGFANRIRLYKDGSLLKEVLPYQKADNSGGDENESLNLANLQDTTNVFGYSSNYSDNYFNGVMDEFRIYNNALPANRIYELFNDFVSLNASSLTAHYSFEGENLGNDDSANGNDLTINGVSSAESKEGLGKGIKFVGEKDKFVEFPQNILTAPNGNKVSSATIAFWFRFDEIQPEGYTQILNFGNMNDDNRIRFMVNNMGEMRLEYEVQGAGNLTELVCWGDAEWRPVANEWYHAAIVIDGSANRIRLYKDGSLLKEVLPYQKADNTGGDESGSLNLANLQDTANVFGYCSNYEDNYFNGVMDEFYIYSTALNSDEISELYNLEEPDGGTEVLKILAERNAAQEVYQGADVSLTFGKYDLLTNISNLAYQWQEKTGGEYSDISTGNYEGVQTSTLVIPNLLENDEITEPRELVYRLKITREGMSVYSADFNVKVSPVSAPVISEQTEQIKAKIGETVTIEVVASGLPDVSYQWYKGDTPLTDGENIKGANEAALTVTVAAETDFGEYHCVVKNIAGETVSANINILKKSTASVTGVEEGKEYGEAVTIRVQDSLSTIVYKDGEIINVDFAEGEHTFTEEGEYRIVATGEDNEQKIFNFTIKTDSGKNNNDMDTGWIVFSVAVAVLVIAAIVFIIVRVQKKKNSNKQ